MANAKGNYLADSDAGSGMAIILSIGIVIQNWMPDLMEKLGASSSWPVSYLVFYAVVYIVAIFIDYILFRTGMPNSVRCGIWWSMLWSSLGRWWLSLDATWGPIASDMIGFGSAFFGFVSGYYTVHFIEKRSSRDEKKS